MPKNSSKKAVKSVFEVHIGKVIVYKVPLIVYRVWVIVYRVPHIVAEYKIKKCTEYKNHHT
jgi:fumarate reductase subunit D